jgi:outer membrane protein insertion porin family
MRVRFPSAGVAVFLLCLAGQSPSTNAVAAETATTLDIEGARTVSPDAIRAAVGPVLDGALKPETTDRAVKALMATGHFADVRLERRGVRSVVTVVEHPIAASITIEGNAEIERKKLEEALELKPKGRVTRAKLQADARKLTDLYKRQGRLATTVEAKSTPRSEGHVDVVFVVREAPVSKIDRIDFAGNRAFSVRQLKDVISTSESGWLDVFKTAAFYDPDRIETDRELIRRQYANSGYPDARITSVDAVPNGEGTGFTVVFTIDEGPAAQIGTATIESVLPGALPGSTTAALKVKPGAVYSREAIERSVEGVSEALSKEGQPFVRVTPVHRASADGQIIDIVFRLEAAPPLYAERIDITGNTRTKDHVIRRELRLTEGDPVNAFLIERARLRVQRTGFFKTVTVKTAKGATPDRVVVTFDVTEQPTGDFGVGGGYSTSEGIVGDIGWTERNLFGNGQSLRFKVAGSATRFQADIGFTEPRILGSNVAAGFDLFYKDVDYTRQSSYMSTRAGGTVRLGLPIDDQWSTGVSYTFARSTLYNVGPNASAAIREAVPGFPTKASTTYDTSSIGTSVTYDGRDNKKRPSSGVYYTLVQDFAGAGGDVRFVRNTGEARAYYAVSDSVTAMGRTSGGVIGGWGGQDVRLLDMFTKGSETIRGFGTAGFGPRDTLSANADALGGRMFFVTTAEMLFDIPGIPRDLGLRAAVFADAGSLWGVNRTAAALPGVVGQTPSLRATAGIGLAWDSPLGPLRVDYAVPLVKQPYDKLQPLSFGLVPF